MRYRNNFNLQRDREGLTSVKYICLICFAIGIAAIAWPVLRNNGFPLDDSWIHQVVGRNAFEFGVPGFAPGVASSGSSSAIWPWIISINYRFFPSINHVDFLFALNTIFLFVICGILFKFSAKDILTPLEICALAAIPPLTGNVVWLVSTGMEHLLFVATIFSASYFWLLPIGVRGLARSFVAGIFCGLAITTRLEAVAFIPIFLFSAWPLRKTRGDILFFIAPCALAVALVLLNNWWTSGSVLPVTYSGRKWLSFGATPSSAPILAAKLLISSGMHILRYFFGIAAGTFWSFGAIFAALIAVIFCGLLRLIKLKAWRILFLIILTATNIGTYCIMLPTYGQGMRYFSMALIFVFPLFALGGIELIERAAARLNITPEGCQRGKMLVVATVAVLGFSSLFSWSQITDLSIKHINGTEIRMGKWLAANLPPNEQVASFDIGAIGYFSGEQIIDLGGLTDPKFTPYLISNQSAEYLKKNNIRWLVLPMGSPDLNSGLHDSCNGLMARLTLCDRPEMTKQDVKSFSTSIDVWKIGYSAIKSAAPSQVLYEITWH